VSGTIYPFPFEKSREAEKFASSLVRETLPKSTKFLIYGGAQNVSVWQTWFAARPELAGWRSRGLGPFGDVDAVVFELPQRVEQSSARQGSQERSGN
jgi:hypothetical protein